MKYSLDTLRKAMPLSLLQDEEVLKYFTASYDVRSSLTSSWRLGNLYLTNRRLLFVQGRKILFGTPLNDIRDINIVKRKWILGKKVKQLHIVSQSRKIPYIAIKNPEEWKKAIVEQTSFVGAGLATALFDRATARVAPTTHNSQPIIHNLQPDEVILKGKGGYLSPSQSRWKLGTLILTNKNLTFLQPSDIIWETPLNSIKDLRIEKRVYGVSKSDTICVSYDRGQKTEDREQIRKVWIISPDLETWRKKLYEKVLLKVDEETLDKIATKLDADSKEVLWFIYENRHARINTLTKRIEADTHMDVLLKIREIINPTAQKIIGYPILSFESSKVDWETGENVTFSWWLTGQPHRERKEPLLDIFDENSHLIVYLELLGLNEDEIQISIVGAIHESSLLIIDADKNYHKEILLPAMVSTNNFTKRYKNNILEVRLKKAN